MNSFNDLKILSVEKNTEDSVILSFKIPENLKKPFSFKAGQYITLENKINEKIIKGDPIQYAHLQMKIF